MCIGYFACIDFFVSYMHVSYLWRPEEEDGSLEIGDIDSLLATILVLGIKHRSPGRAASAFNH